MDRFSTTVALVGSLLLAGCTAPRTRVVLHRGEVKTLDQCKVRLENTFKNDGKAFAGLQVACDVTAGPNWWGTGNEPLAFSLGSGDCGLLKDWFYCATALDADESVTLERAYRFEGGNVLARAP